MTIEDTIVKISKRVKKLDAEGYLFHSTNKPGISLREDERFLREFMQDHPARRYCLFGLGNYTSPRKLTSFINMAYNASIIGVAAASGNGSILKKIGVNITEPPKGLSKEEKVDLQVSTPLAWVDMIFPELISIGYGTKFGNMAATVGHLDNGDYWTIGEVNIGTNVFVGAQTVICPGVKIGDYAKINICKYLYWY